MIKSKNAKFMVLIVFPIAISICFCIFCHREPISSDGKEYDILAKNLLSFKGYTLDGVTPYALRPPLYSLFVALIYLFTKCNPIAVVIMQIILVAFVPYILYKTLLFAGFKEKESFIAALLVAFYPFGYIYVQQLVTEPFTTFLFVLAAYCTIKIWLTIDLNFFEVLLLGMIITLPSLSKSQHISLISALIISLAIKSFFEKELIKGVKKRIIPLILGAAILLSPWALRNYYHFRNPAVLGEGAFGELLLKGFYETKGRWFLLTFWNEKSSGEMQSFKDWQIKMREAEILSEEQKIPLGEAKAKIALDEIRNEPLEAIRGYFVRLYSFWLMIPTEQSLKMKVMTIFIDLFLLILAIIGFIVFYDVLLKKLFPVYLCLFSENAILAIGHMEARYSISVKIFVIMVVGLLLSKFIERIKNVRE